MSQRVTREDVEGAARRLIRAAVAARIIPASTTYTLSPGSVTNGHSWRLDVSTAPYERRPFHPYLLAGAKSARDADTRLIAAAQALEMVGQS
jgi:hypothetical protein